MFFDSWTGLLRVVVVGTLAYAGLVLMLRVSGKRTLSKMNAFDLIVTVALGSTLATVVLTKEVALFEGLLAFALLIGLQWIVTWLSVRSSRWSHLVKSEPRLLVFRGAFIESALREERLTRDEVHAVVRDRGISSVEEVAGVILETDGTVSVIRSLSAATHSMAPVRGFKSEGRDPARFQGA